MQMKNNQISFHLGDQVMTPEQIAGVVMKINKDSITVVLPFPIGFREYSAKSLCLLENKKGD